MDDGVYTTIREAAEAWGVTKPTISSKLDQLEGSGALEPGHVHRGAGKGGATLLDREAMHALAGLMGPAKAGGEEDEAGPGAEEAEGGAGGGWSSYMAAPRSDLVAMLEGQIGYLEGQLRAKDGRIERLESQVDELGRELLAERVARAQAEAELRVAAAEAESRRRRGLAGWIKGLLGDGTGAAKSHDA